MWVPAVSAAAASILAIRESGTPFSLRKFFSLSGFRVCRPGYILMGILIPFAYLLIPYMIYWRMHPENYAYNGVPLRVILGDCFLPSVIGTCLGLLTAAGEEIGWRGFLVPALTEKTGYKRMLLNTGLFWCLWHFPLLIWGGSLIYSLIAFVTCIFPVSVILGILRLESGSVWPCAFLHAAHNNFDQSIFGVMTKGMDKIYYVGETGIFTILCVWTAAAILYIRFDRKRQKE